MPAVQRPSGQYLYKKTARSTEDGLTCRVADTYVYQGYAKSEMRPLDYLLKYRCVNVLRGQDDAISYDGKRSYPDFVYLNQLNQIALLEVNVKGDFLTQNNLKKYPALAKHCAVYRLLAPVLSYS